MIIIIITYLYIYIYDNNNIIVIIIFRHVTQKYNCYILGPSTNIKNGRNE